MARKPAKPKTPAEQHACVVALLLSLHEKVDRLLARGVTAEQLDALSKKLDTSEHKVSDAITQAG